MGNTQSAKSPWIATRHWLDGIALSGVFLLIACTLAAQDKFTSSFMLSEIGWAGVFCLLILSYLSICWARGAMLWTSFLKRKFGATERDIAREEPNPFTELFLYLVMALFVLALVALASISSSSPLAGVINLDVPWQGSVYFAGLVAAFLPLFVGFRLLARKVYGQNYTPDHISRQSVYYGVLIIALIICLAWAASSKLIPENDPFFGAYILGLVLILFLVFVSIPHVQAVMQRNTRQQSTTNYSQEQIAGFLPKDPAMLVSVFDGFLVRSVAPLSGATQHTKDGFSLLPHILLVSIFLPLTVMGFALPAPFGLVPIVFATVLAVGLGRRWSWVEADRETAMRIHKLKDNNIRIGFLNDLRDEALLGYAFLFVLIPLALRQIQLWIAPFAPVVGDLEAQGSLVAWAQFFGTELAKGVPIVDWADIYDLKSNAPFKADNPLSQHLVFGARLLVDIVIIAALLQAWGIVRRNADQMNLFKDGQLDMLDPFAERTMFRRGVKLDGSGKAILTKELSDLFSEHASNAKRLYKREIPYNEGRLADLAQSKEPKYKALALKLADDYSLLVGRAVDQMVTLKQSWEANKTQFSGDGNSAWLREQRYLFEGILERSLDENLRLNEEQITTLGELISLTKKEKSLFLDARLLAYRLIGLQKTVFAATALISALMSEEKMREAELANSVSENPKWPFSREGYRGTREAVLLSIESVLTDSQGHKPLPARTKTMCMEALEWAATHEFAQPKLTAQEILQRLRIVRDA